MLLAVVDTPKQKRAFLCFLATDAFWWTGLLIAWYSCILYASSTTAFCCNLWFIHIWWTSLCFDFLENYIFCACLKESSFNSWYQVNRTGAFESINYSFFKKIDFISKFWIAFSFFFFFLLFLFPGFGVFVWLVFFFKSGAWHYCISRTWSRRIKAHA